MRRARPARTPVRTGGSSRSVSSGTVASSNRPGTPASCSTGHALLGRARTRPCRAAPRTSAVEPGEHPAVGRRPRTLAEQVEEPLAPGIGRLRARARAPARTTRPRRRPARCRSARRGMPRASQRASRRSPRDPHRGARRPRRSPGCAGRPRGRPQPPTSGRAAAGARARARRGGEEQLGKAVDAVRVNGQRRRERESRASTPNG